jgi:hypothetical protein
VTSHGDIEVDEEGFMTMMFETGNTYPRDDALGHEWVSEVAIHDMDTCEARQKLNEQQVKAIIEAPPEKQRRMKDRQQLRANALHGKRDPFTWVDSVKLRPLPQPHLCARTYRETYPSAQRATHLRSVLARVCSVSRQNLNTTTVP